MSQPKKVKLAHERTHSAHRTKSKQFRSGARNNKMVHGSPKFAAFGKAPNPHQPNWKDMDACANMGVYPNPFFNPPMNLKSKTAGEFSDIDACFGNSESSRVIAGGTPHKRRYA